MILIVCIISVKLSSIENRLLNNQIMKCTISVLMFNNRVLFKKSVLLTKNYFLVFHPISALKIISMWLILRTDND